jgi:hypothetical protein
MYLENTTFLYNIYNIKIDLNRPYLEKKYRIILFTAAISEDLQDKKSKHLQSTSLKE